MVLANSETWKNLSKGNIQELANLQKNMLASIFQQSI